MRDPAGPTAHIGDGFERPFQALLVTNDGDTRHGMLCRRDDLLVGPIGIQGKAGYDRFIGKARTACEVTG